MLTAPEGHVLCFFPVNHWGGLGGPRLVPGVRVRVSCVDCSFQLASGESWASPHLHPHLPEPARGVPDVWGAGVLDSLL